MVYKKFLLGFKLGNTRIYDSNGEIPVTVIKAGPCYITGIINSDHNAVQIGFYPVDESKIKKPQLGLFKKLNLQPLKYLREFRVDPKDLNNFKVGDKIDVSIFKENEAVDVTGISKGKGFAGVVKRWGFAGGSKTHGQSDRHRAPGSIGSQGFQRVIKGKKMAGHLGCERVTVKNLRVVKVIPEENLILLKGSVPGPKMGVVEIKI